MQITLFNSHLQRTVRILLVVGALVWKLKFLLQIIQLKLGGRW